MTRITPRRRTILQCSHIFLTDARTFMFKASSFRLKYAPRSNRKASIAISPCRRPAGRQTSFLSRPATNAVRRCPLANSATYVPFGKRFPHPGFDAKGAFAHVKISGSPSVIRTECSKWADSEPSCVTTVQPSFKIFILARPALTIGSMAIVMPGFNLGESFKPSSKFGTCGSSCIVRPTPWPTNSRTTLNPFCST